jgi:serine/threonine protein kinase/Tfp pilus assembly protein PilF
LNVNSECLPCLVRIAFDEPAEAATAPPASLVFGDFEVEQRPDGSYWELGHGAMGVTYLAMDKVLHRRVALKVIEVPATARRSQAMRERFLREARAAAALRHPNVAGVFQFGASPDASHCYYAMEVVEGETLEARVRRDGPLNAKSTLEIAIQITRALMAAAAQGLIHRDLKPGNIMLTRGDTDTAEPEVKVIDFGLAKAIADAGGETDLTHGEFVGTPNFASPEQFRSGQVDARSDIYSLGATLWFALTGLAPHSGSTIEEIRDRQTRDDLPVEQLVARKVPEPMIKLLRSTLAIDPAGRPASARELMEALESCRRKLSHGIGVYKIAALIAVVAIVAAALSVIWLNRREITSASARNAAPSASALTPLPQKSIAVLPLENLSRDPDNAYFAVGIQEEILTRLAKIADLKVISRTSTQQYQSKPGNFAEIAKQLGVANILEGSVQKAADQVRVNVHLVNAQTGSQLWAETYDRKLSDILVLESEIAKRIAESLQAKLTGREEQALAAKPTNNPEAYDAYLRGLVFEARSNYSSDALFKAIDFYQLAVQLDPNFALAWARLSGAHALLYFNRGDATAARRDAAKEALENAQKLQPNSPETLLFVGYYQYWVQRDYELAKTTFERVSGMLPGNGEVSYALGAVARRQGLWDESVAYWERGLALDPRNTALLIEVAWTYAALRQFPTALKLYDRALDILPDELSLMALKASIYQAQGNLQEAAKLLAQVNAQTDSDAAVRIRLTQLRLERNQTEAIRFVQARQAQPHFAFGIEKGMKQGGLALIQRVAGDTAAAKAAAEQARNTLEPLNKDQPDNVFVPAALAVDYAILEEKSSALNEAQRAITLVPNSKDRLSGPGFEENLALVEMIIGENSRAISTLARLLQTPYGGWLYNPAPITPAILKLDPLWDPLRADPAFQKLCEEKQP